MKVDYQSSVLTNAQAGAKFLAEAILESNNAIYEPDAKKREKHLSELRGHLQCATAHFEAQFEAQTLADA